MPPPLRRDPKEGDPPTAALAGSRGPVGGDPSRVEDELLEKIIRPAAQEAIDKAYLRGYEDGYRKASGLRSMSDSDHKILSSLFAGAINASCTENVSDTPDLLLAEAATGVLDIFQTLINKRTAYYEQ